MQVNFCTGDYQFTRCGAGGFTLIGRGTIGRTSGAITLHDARVRANFDTSFLGRNTGRATIKLGIFRPLYIIEDNGSNGGACGCH